MSEPSPTSPAPVARVRLSPFERALRSSGCTAITLIWPAIIVQASVTAALLHEPSIVTVLIGLGVGSLLPMTVVTEPASRTQFGRLTNLLAGWLLGICLMLLLAGGAGRAAPAPDITWATFAPVKWWAGGGAIVLTALFGFVFVIDGVGTRSYWKGELWSDLGKALVVALTLAAAVGIAAAMVCAGVAMANAPSPPPQEPVNISDPLNWGAWAVGLLLGVFLAVLAGHANDPTGAATLNLRGVRALNAGQLQTALAVFDEAVRRDPKSKLALQNRGRVHYQLGHHDRALADFDIVVRLDPNLPNPFAWRVVCQLARKEYDQAIANANEYIRLTNAKPDANGVKHEASLPKELQQSRRDCVTRRGLANLGKGEVDRALIDFDWVLKSQSRADAHTGRARCRLLKGDNEGALKDLDVAIGQAPRSADALALRAEVHAALGNTAKAEDDRRQAAMWSHTA